MLYKQTCLTSLWKAEYQGTEERPNPSQSFDTMAISEDNVPEEAEIQFYIGMVLKPWSIGKPLHPDGTYLVHRNHLKYIMQSTRMFGGLYWFEKFQPFSPCHICHESRDHGTCSQTQILLQQHHPSFSTLGLTNPSHTPAYRWGALSIKIFFFLHYLPHLIPLA